MSKLKIHPKAENGRIVHVTPESAGWTHVGFDIWKLKPGEVADGGEKGREVCLVFIGGKGHVFVGAKDFGVLGERNSPFEGKPWSVYIPAGESWKVVAENDVTLAVCTAPGEGGKHPARVIGPDALHQETRGKGSNTRHVTNIIPEWDPAEGLLVVEVITPGGCTSSYPPHKHDEDNLPHESALAFGIPVQFDRAHIEGITKLTAEDIRYAEELGYRIKLLGITKRKADGFELRVHPTLIPSKRLIANVEGVMNAVVVKGDAVGATLYYGRGAGAEPTASAVIADLVDVTRLHTADPEHRVPHLAFRADQLSDTPILPISEVESAYYLRLRVQDRPGVLADITRILADQGISIDAMLQKEPSEGEQQANIIMLTHVTREKQVDAAIVRIEGLDSTVGAVTRLRLEELNG